MSHTPPAPRSRARAKPRSSNRPEPDRRQPPQDRDRDRQRSYRQEGGADRRRGPERQGSRSGLPKVLIDIAQILLGLSLASFIAFVCAGAVVGVIILIYEMTK
jgi:hypothetical protein